MTMKKNKTRQIMEALEAHIIQGIYPPYTRLPPERDLARSYKTNRFAIREALAMLAQMGFVETRPQSGTYVRPFGREGTVEMLTRMVRVKGVLDRDHLTALLEYRRVNETQAAQRAARVITPEELSELADILKEKKDSLDDPETQSRQDFLFHRGILAAGGNLIHQLIFNSFRPVYAHYTRFFYGINGTAERSLELNRQLLQALEDKDPGAARTAMEAILTHGGEEVLKAAAREKHGGLPLTPPRPTP